MVIIASSKFRNTILSNACLNISLVPRLRVPLDEEWSGEWSQISWAYYPKQLMTNEIARSVILRSTFLTTENLFISIRASIPFLSRLATKWFDRCSVTSVAKACANQKNSTWFTRPFLLGMRLSDYQAGEITTATMTLKLYLTYREQYDIFHQGVWPEWPDVAMNIIKNWISACKTSINQVYATPIWFLHQPFG